jgi:starch phosphorylase
MREKSLNELLEQYGCGPIQFTGTSDALYEQHLTFDHVVDVKKADLREQFEAAAHSIRDIVSQRWLKTEKTHEQKNPQRVSKYTTDIWNVKPCPVP